VVTTGLKTTWTGIAVEPGHDLLGMVGDPPERLIAVKLLAARDEPNFESAERLRHQSLLPVLITFLAPAVTYLVRLVAAPRM